MIIEHVLFALLTIVVLIRWVVYFYRVAEIYEGHNQESWEYYLEHYYPDELETFNKSILYLALVLLLDIAVYFIYHG